MLIHEEYTSLEGNIYQIYAITHFKLCRVYVIMRNLLQSLYEHVHKYYTSMHRTKDGECTSLYVSYKKRYNVNDWNEL